MEPLLAALAGDEEVAALFSDAADLAAMLRVEAALAEATAEAGLITAEAAARIVAVCQAFTPDQAALLAGMARDGVVVPALVAQLRAAVGEPHGAAVHKGATSQDVVDTSLMLRLQEATGLLARRRDAVAAQIASLADREGARPLMAHTRMQAALPFTVADKVRGWAAPLDRLASRLADLAPRLLVIQLGGPIGTRAEFGASGQVVAEAFARRLNLRMAPAWHAQRDGLGEFAAWCSLVSGAAGKIGADVALLAQSEVAAVALAGVGGSSAMAHKRNPVAAETLVALARFNAGLLGTFHQALVHENERSGAAWTLEWLVLPQMVVATAASLRIAGALLDGLTFTRSDS